MGWAGTQSPAEVHLKLPFRHPEPISHHQGAWLEVGSRPGTPSVWLVCQQVCAARPLNQKALAVAVKSINAPSSAATTFLGDEPPDRSTRVSLVSPQG